jgi:hypothetical protein
LGLDQNSFVFFMMKQKVLSGVGNVGWHSAGWSAGPKKMKKMSPNVREKKGRRAKHCRGYAKFMYVHTYLTVVVGKHAF